jgi:hypothetical protein
MYPAAQMSPAELPLTPARMLTMELGLGLGTFDQVVPFQCKISVSSTAQALVVQ